MSFNVRTETMEYEGKTYTLTAVSTNGYTFTNWTGGTNFPLTWLTNGTAVTFVMHRRSSRSCANSPHG